MNSNFLDQLIARTFAASTDLGPRLPARFETPDGAALTAPLTPPPPEPAPGLARVPKVAPASMMVQPAFEQPRPPAPAPAQPAASAEQPVYGTVEPLQPVESSVPPVIPQPLPILAPLKPPIEQLVRETHTDRVEIRERPLLIPAEPEQPTPQARATPALLPAIPAPSILPQLPAPPERIERTRRPPSSPQVTVRVTIGSIQVTAPAPAPAPPPLRRSAPPPARPARSLDEYLRSRSGGNR